MDITVGLYDIHNHSIFGVDDGSKSMDMSLAMMDIAYEEGIRGIILTPHYNKRIWDVDGETIEAVYKQLTEKVNEKYPDMQLYLGCEIYYNQETEGDLAEGRISSMAGSKYILIEFNTSESYRRIKQAVVEALQNDYLPIIAHVERYECIMKDASLIGELIDQGAYIQVNAKTIDGENGRAAKKLAKGLLKQHLVHFVGTDAHRDSGRAPYIQNSYKYVAKKFGHDYAQEIYVYNPQSVIANEYIEI